MSGVMTIPMILGFVIFALIAGFGVTLIGYYVPFMLAGGVFLVLGSGLITTLKVTTSRVVWIMFQVPLGAGGGFGVEQPYLAAMTVLKIEDVPVGVALISFTQALGSALSVTAAEVVFNNCLVSGWEAADPNNTTLGGPTPGLPTGTNPTVAPEVLVLYNKAIISTFYIALASGSLAILAALGMEWVSVKETKKEEDTA